MFRCGIEGNLVKFLRGESGSGRRILAAEFGEEMGILKEKKRKLRDEGEMMRNWVADTLAFIQQLRLRAWGSGREREERERGGFANYFGNNYCKRDFFCHFMNTIVLYLC